MKPKTVAEASRDYRARMKDKGFVFVTVAVLKENVAAIKEIEKADKASKKGKGNENNKY